MWIKLAKPALLILLAILLGQNVGQTHRAAKKRHENC